MEYAIAASPRTGEVCSEDACGAELSSEGVFIAAVVDVHHVGKRGNLEAVRAAQDTKEILLGALERGTLNESRTIAAFALADRYLVDQHPSVGAVATTVGIRQDLLYLGHVGDTRLYTSEWSEKGFSVLTRDHTLSNMDELQRLEPHLRSGKFQARIEVHHGRVVQRLYRKGVFGWKKDGIIPVRSLGDTRFRPALIPEPEIQVLSFTRLPQHQLFALCSDGARRAVERVYWRLRGRIPIIDITEVMEMAQEEFERHLSDDATVLFFRRS